MNQRSTGLSLTKALSGFLQYKSAEGLAPVTVTGYERDLKLWIQYQGETDIRRIRSPHIVAFLTYLRTVYVPPASPVIIPRSSPPRPSITSTAAWPHSSNEALIFRTVSGSRFGPKNSISFGACD